MLGDRVRETTTTTGTGDITLAGAATGFVSFNAFFGTNVPCAYYIASSGGTEWEGGIGHLSGSTTLVRDQVLRSSTGSAVNFSAGTKDVFCDEPAEVRATRGLVTAQIASRGLR